MKVLVVCRGKSGNVSPFVAEQVAFIERLGVECRYFLIEQSGLKGYISNIGRFYRAIREFRPDIIHAHYGLSGLLANLQKAVPVVTTYHGSDINLPKAFRLSKWAIKLSKHNIFVSQKTLDKSKKYSRHLSLIPCGVDIDLFIEKDRTEAKKEFGFSSDRKKVLFSSSFSNEVKNPELAQKTVALLKDTDLIELKGYSREQVSSLMNAVDCCLMTSHTEGSPQFIKEAMACGCPIVSVDVGDVKEVISDVEGCFIAEKDANDLAKKIEQATNTPRPTQGRERLLAMWLDNREVAQRVLEVYKKVLQKR